MSEQPAVKVLMLKGEKGSQGNGISKEEMAKINYQIKSSVADLGTDIVDSLNSKLVNARYVPESFANSTDLKNKYPNGKDGIFITADTGHMWVFANGNWIDAGVYQTAGKFKVHNGDLGDDVMTAFNVEGKYLDFDIIQGKFYSSANNKFIASEQAVVSSEIPVAEGEVYGVTANTFYDGHAVTFFDSAKKVVAVFPENTEDAIFSTKVTVPANATTMILGSKVGRPIAAVKQLRIFPKENIDEAKIIKTHTDFTPVIYDTQSETVYWKYSNGLLHKDDHTLPASKPIKVYPGEIYRISGTNYWDGRLWIMLDSNGKVVKYFDKNDNSTYSKQIVVIPNDVCFLLINSYGEATTLEKGSENLSGEHRKITAVGDSWTASKTLSGRKNWVDYVIESFKKKDVTLTVDNQGIGGTGYVAGGNGTNVPFYTRTIGGDSDLYLIFGSFNDLYVNWEIGSLGDTSTSTLFGCMKAVCDKIIKANVGAKIGIISPAPWGDVNAHNPNEYKQKAESYVSALKEFAGYYNIPFLDLYHGGVLRPWDSNFVNAYYHGTSNTDTTHTNTKGHKLFAPIIANFISSMID